MTDPLLAIDGLSARLRKPLLRPLLRSVSLDVKAGEVHGLVGESGAGKSTIGKAVLGILPRAIEICGGAIHFAGEDLLRLPHRRLDAILGDEIALIPQDPMTALNPSRRIGDQLTDGLRLKRGMRGAALHARAVELLADVQIPEPEAVLKRYPHEISGGMRQRILIAAAFSLDPKLILADEPTTALDVTVQKEVLRLIRRMQAAHGTGVVFVTHDLGVVAQICDRLTVLYGGMVVEQGETATILASPAHAYTRALLAATPRHDQAGSGTTPIPPAVTAALATEVACYGMGPAAHG
ncbi:ABC transporter ATP-binding protein [Mangrovibrevibacter kandeliae]|uniref:ABC transporter ATP-binding protein n=1 Tax=Mangrovibrevibacter kandeliae TaxID=2968473 RepID=UPI002119072E|nr:ABC transporter ATP-binding protein [Aurantimonas sp. CSK15Z-1]MCQ8782146.1 ABC transporter ATP-binding protein [Aurantimonas sp. CSK15Z-1]